MSNIEESESDNGKTDEEYEYEREQINKMFPNANFTIAIDLNDLDDVITTRPFIIVKSSYFCYCYDNNKKESEYFYVSGNNITNKVILNTLIEQKLCLECNHQFVEGFHQVTDCQFEIVTGS